MRRVYVVMGSLATLSLAAALAGCNGSSEVPDDIASDQQAANDYQQTLFKTLPDKQQQEVTAAQAALEGRLREEFDKARVGTGASTALARFAERRLSALDGLQALLPKLSDLMKKTQAEFDTQQGKGLTEFQLRSAQTRMVKALREREAQQRYLQMAINADSLVAEAYRRWNESAIGDRISLTRTVEGLARQPCTFAGGAKPAEGRFTIDGVAPGMDRASVIAALCAAKNKDVMLAREETQRSHQLKGEAGFGPTSHLSELPWTMNIPSIIPGDPQTRSRLAQPYVANIQYCFECKSGSSNGIDGAAQMRNSMDVRFLPNGKAVSITRTELFGRTVQRDLGDGRTETTWEAEPRPLKTLVASLQQQFGEPSFIWSSGRRPVFGWVFPDGRTSLPQERWFLTNTSGRELIQLNSPGLIFDGQVFSRTKLAAANPRAGYCLSRHSGPWGLFSHSVRNYFAYDQEWAVSEAYIATRRNGLTIPSDRALAYDVRYEAPGFVDRCGIIISVTFAKDARRDNIEVSGEVTQPLSPDTPIHRMTVQMIDTNAAREAFVAQEKAVQALAPATDERQILRGVAVGPAEVANREAGLMRARDYEAWRTCLYQRQRNAYGYEDEVRCQRLDPQGRVPHR